MGGKKGTKRSKKIRLFGRKKRNLNFTFQHTFIWEGKKRKRKKRTLPTHVHLGGEKKHVKETSSTHVYLGGKKIKRN